MSCGCTLPFVDDAHERKGAQDALLGEGRAAIACMLQRRDERVAKFVREDFHMARREVEVTRDVLNGSHPTMITMSSERGT